MRSLLYTIFLFFVLAPTLSAQPGVTLTNLGHAELVAQAQTRSLPIMLVTQPSDCQGCTALTDSSLAIPAVGDYFNRFFLVSRIKCNQPGWTDLCQRADLHNVPGLLFLSPDGVLIYSVRGTPGPDELLKQGKKAISKLERAADWKIRYQRGERSLPFLAQYIAQLSATGQDYTPIYKEYFRRQPATNWPQRESWVVFRDFGWAVNDSVTQYVITNRRYYGQRYTYDSVDAALYRIFERELTEAPDSISRLAVEKTLYETDLKTARLAIARNHYLRALDSGNPQRVRRAIADYIGEYPGTLAEDYYTAAEYLLANFTDKRAIRQAQRYAQYAAGKAPSAPSYALYARALAKAGKTDRARKNARIAHDMAAQTGLEMDYYNRLLAEI